MDCCLIIGGQVDTSKVTIATYDGSQKYAAGATWGGTLQYTNLIISDTLDGNPSATVTLYNAHSTIDAPLIKEGCPAWFVYQGKLRFSGVIETVREEIVGYSTGSLMKTVYHLTIESDANYLTNLTSHQNHDKYERNTSVATIVSDIVAPFSQWVQSAWVTNATTTVDYRIKDAPMLQQINEVCGLAGLRYRTRTAWCTSTTNGASCTDTLIQLTGASSGDTIIEHLKISGIPTVAIGSSNRYISLIIGGALSHLSVRVITESKPATNNFTTLSAASTGINATITTDLPVLIIMSPVIEVKQTYVAASPDRTFYTRPTLSTTYLCWDFKPVRQQSSVKTKVTAHGTDYFGNPISVDMTAAYMYSSTTKQFLLDATSVYQYVTLSEWELAEPNTTTSLTIYADAMGTGDWGTTVPYPTAPAGFPADMSIYILGRQDTNPERYYCTCDSGAISTAAIVGTPTVVNGRAAMVYSGLTLDRTYVTGSIVGMAYNYNGTIYPVIWVSDKTNVSGAQWIGREYLTVQGNITKATYGIGLYVTRQGMVSAPSFTSRKGYVISGMAPIGHLRWTPILTGTEYDVDDVYTNSPIALYGLQSHDVTVNVSRGKGYLEKIAYDTVRNLCLPQYPYKCEFTTIETKFKDGSAVPLKVGSNVAITDGSVTYPAFGNFVILSYRWDVMSGFIDVMTGTPDSNLFSIMAAIGKVISM
jgi:hypothetical protein